MTFESHHSQLSMCIIVIVSDVADFNSLLKDFVDLASFPLSGGSRSVDAQIEGILCVIISFVFRLEPALGSVLVSDDGSGIARNVDQIPVQVGGADLLHNRVKTHHFRVFTIEGLYADPGLVERRTRIHPAQVDRLFTLVAHLEFETVLFETEFDVHRDNGVISVMLDHPIVKVGNPRPRVHVLVMGNDKKKEKEKDKERKKERKKKRKKERK